jgi:[protein-PII] uridylyltransferase
MIRESLVKALSHPEQFPTIVQKRLPRQLKHFSVKTEVNISNDITNNKPHSKSLLLIDRVY